jgi:hypothetical protein
MTYVCKDCSYRGKIRGQDGSCPACGSFNYGTRASDEPTESSTPGKFRLLLLAALWAYLIGLIIWKLIH